MRCSRASRPSQGTATAPTHPRFPGAVADGRTSGGDLVRQRLGSAGRRSPSGRTGRVCRMSSTCARSMQERTAAALEGNTGVRDAAKTPLTETFAMFSGRAGPGVPVVLAVLPVASIVLMILITAPGNASSNTPIGTAGHLLACAARPSTAVSVPCLHDTDRSGWWLLLSFVPLGALVLLVSWLPPPGPRNRHGRGTAPATCAAPGCTCSPPADRYPDPTVATAQRY